MEFWTGTSQRIRSRLAAHRSARKVREVMRAKERRLWTSLLGPFRFDRLPAPVALHVAYDVLFGRHPDPDGLATYLPQLKNGELTHRELLQVLRGSQEFEASGKYTLRTFASSIHAGRCRFIRSLPQADRIVDLGGTSLGDPRGAMVSLGYPYRFESLVIVDLPSDERHRLYQSRELSDVVETDRGPVSYRYHSMVDLSGFPDESVDLVYSGQSIEHVSPEEGMMVIKEVNRILRPGGHFALDTPNARVTRLQQPDFIDPDHKVEYRWGDLEEMLTAAGFHLEWRKGLNYAGQSVATGTFDLVEVAGNVGMFDAIEDCYILCAVASKPAGDSAS